MSKFKPVFIVKCVKRFAEKFSTVWKKVFLISSLVK